MECPICGEQVKEGQHYCTGCGRDLTKSVTWHCTHCYGDVTEYDRENMEFCPHCAQPTNDNYLADDELPQPRKKKKKE